MFGPREKNPSEIFQEKVNSLYDHEKTDESDESDEETNQEEEDKE